MLLANPQGCLLDHLSFGREYRLTSTEKYYLNKEIEFQLLNETQVQNNMKFLAEDTFVLALHKGTLQYIVDGSFYTIKSKYILAVQFISEAEVIVAKGDFITIVAEEYRHPYAAKICSVLAYLKMIYNILFKYPNVSRKIKLGVGSDC